MTPRELRRDAMRVLAVAGWAVSKVTGIPAADLRPDLATYRSGRRP
jgi:hypothetical protein